MVTIICRLFIQFLISTVYNKMNAVWNLFSSNLFMIFSPIEMLKLCEAVWFNCCCQSKILYLLWFSGLKGCIYIGRKQSFWPLLVWITKPLKMARRGYLAIGYTNIRVYHHFNTFTQVCMDTEEVVNGE